jgi:hypothetical protein
MKVASSCSKLLVGVKLLYDTNQRYLEIAKIQYKIINDDYLPLCRDTVYTDYFP